MQRAILAALLLQLVAVTEASSAARSGSDTAVKTDFKLRMALCGMDCEGFHLPDCRCRRAETCAKMLRDHAPFSTDFNAFLQKDVRHALWPEKWDFNVKDDCSSSREETVRKRVTGVCMWGEELQKESPRDKFIRILNCGSLTREVETHAHYFMKRDIRKVGRETAIAFILDVHGMPYKPTAIAQSGFKWGWMHTANVLDAVVFLATHIAGKEETESTPQLSHLAQKWLENRHISVASFIDPERSYKDKDVNKVTPVTVSFEERTAAIWRDVQKYKSVYKEYKSIFE
eukprot:GDKI01016268.1.p1 GENE.GDKI01016268.1~~GDKI01016268.1.p1  ORF type:complete len:287 (-),score=73.38 GDKI01016268.1:253-1113(-)